LTWETEKHSHVEGRQVKNQMNKVLLRIKKKRKKNLTTQCDKCYGGRGPGSPGIGGSHL
jgi:hypothetical protein